MVFSSILFLFRFLPIVLVLYYIAPRKLKNTVLFLASLVFYAWGEPVYVVLMIFSTIFNYIFGILVDRAKAREKVKAAKAVVAVSVVVNLAILGYFKYADFLIANVNAIFKTSIPSLKLALPIGISFYTFQTMSYIIDVYRGDAKAQKNIISFGTYVALFPQLIAGPIVRYNTIAEQLERRKETVEGISYGVVRFVTGMGKKVLIANNIGMLFDAISAGNISSTPALTAWLGAIAYTFQIYFDFSGYSDMAIGLGKIFGFDFPENFKHPYIATSLTEFWRRWHISLSSWFRDYVYIPLGGSRRGEARTYINLMIVWLLTGIWHGANYTFVVWGLLYGILLMIEKVICAHKAIRKQSLIQKIAGHFYTMIVVTLAWVIFRSDSINDALIYILGMFGRGSGKLVDRVFVAYLKQNICFYIPAIIGCMPILESLEIKFGEKNPIYNVAFGATVLAGFVISVSYIINNGYNPFIYFNF